MKKLFIAVPAGDGKLTYDCHESIIRNTHYLRDKGYEVFPYYHPCHIYIDRARSLCVDKFLSSDCNDMLFIDSDVGFDNDAIWKLLQHDKDIVAGAYPYRKDHLLDFPVIIDFSRGNNCKEEETGLVYAKVVPTGFMRIQRRVFEKIISLSEKKPENVYVIQKDNVGIYDFFRTGVIFPNDNTWYGEDVAFCMWWTAMGGEIFIEPNINFTHTGFKQFKGNFHEYLLGRKVEAIVDNLDRQEGLRGWTSEAELACLSELASESKDVVEVGSWKGRSTKVLLESCKGTVYAVDHWKGSNNDPTSIVAESQDVYKAFLSNVGEYKNLQILKGDSASMANNFNGNKVDMVFIDADHSYEGCKSDIEAWLPKCNKFMCGHDYNWTGVKKAVTEKFDKINIIDSLWYVRL